jgi:hypothetical protein
MAEFAAKGAERANEEFSKTQNEAAKAMGLKYSAASKGAVDFNLHLIEITQKNTNAAFDLARQLASAMSPSEFIELSSAHVRKQFEAFAEQAQQLTALAQKCRTKPVSSFRRELRNSNNQFEPTRKPVREIVSLWQTPSVTHSWAIAYLTPSLNSCGVRSLPSPQECAL